MPSETYKLQLAILEQMRKDEHRKIKKYQLLLKGAQERLKEVNKKIKELEDDYKKGG